MILQELVTTVSVTRVPAQTNRFAQKPDSRGNVQQWEKRRQLLPRSSRANTWTLFVPQHSSIFPREKSPPKMGLSQNIVSLQIPPKSPPTPRNVFSLDDSIKGSYQGYIPATQQTLSRFCFGGSQRNHWTRWTPSVAMSQPTFPTKNKRVLNLSHKNLYFSWRWLKLEGKLSVFFSSHEWKTFILHTMVYILTNRVLPPALFKTKIFRTIPSHTSSG